MDLVICSLIQFTQENEKSEPFSYRKKVRIFLVWWASGPQAEQFAFYRIPKTLFTDSAFRKLGLKKLGCI